MPRLGLLRPLALAALLAASGCSEISTRVLPQADLGKYKRVFVEQRLTDTTGVAEEIARELRGMGYDATAGARTMMLPATDLIVTYDDLWAWDFNTYLVEIDVQVRLARGEKILAVGHYSKPSMVFGHPPAAMIHELIAKVFRHA